MIATGEAFGVVEVLDGTDRGPGALDLLVQLAAHAALVVRQAERRSPASSSDVPAAVRSALATLGPDEQRAAGALLGEFLDYLGRRRGPAGVV